MQVAEASVVLTLERSGRLVTAPDGLADMLGLEPALVSVPITWTELLTRAAAHGAWRVIPDVSGALVAAEHARAQAPGHLHIPLPHGGAFAIATLPAADQGVTVVLSRSRAPRAERSSLVLDERMFQQIVDQLPATVSIKDRDGRYLYINRAWRDHYGQSTGNVIGNRFTEIALPTVAQNGGNAHAAEVSGRDRWVVEHRAPLMNREERYLGRDGVERVNLSNKVPLFDADAAVVGILSVTMDITERVRAQESMAVAKIAAERASLTKSRLLAHMSHELRTPLNAVIGFAELIETDLHGIGSGERYRSYAASIGTSGRHLLALIDEILQVADIESNGRALTAEAFALSDVLGPALTAAAAGAARRMVTFEVGAIDDPVTLFGDRSAVTDVLDAVLSNATRFASPGSVVRVHTEADPRELRLLVHDSGVGLGAAAMAHIGEPFGQLGEDAALASVGGLRLGLTIAHRLLSLLGGQLDVRSTAGVGTTVVVRLPRAAQVSPAHAPA